MPRLTKRRIDALPAQEKEYFVWDETLKGFGARVYPNGGKRYVAQTFRRGKTIRVQIGRHGALSFDEAKARARKIIADIDEGRNPNKEKETERLSPTVAELAERFLKEYVPHHCKPRTRVEYRHAVESYILPALGSIKVTALGRDDVAALHHEMREKPYQANRTLGVVSKMMNQAEAWGLRPDRSNPCYHVRKYKEKKRERFLTAEELVRLGKALEEEESFAPSAVTAFRLLLYTGARLSEIQTLKWEHIRGDRIRLRDSKTGAKTIPLNGPALEVLAGTKRVEGNPYVITGTGDGAHLTDLQKPWRRVRKAAGLEDVRIHDLRHTFASEAVMGGESLPMVGRILGHTQAQTTARYAHLADDPLQRASERIASSLKQAMSDQGKEGNRPTAPDA
ncbi:MAG: tyrosine-type recombinase/integrase [Chloroflexi bacterium]|nr:tyrosine-type recombinase/integrase [Chloroflexota bacterium]